MTALFLQLLNMSLTASWIVLAVVLVRLLLPRMPKWVYVLLWGFVALRLLIPGFVETGFSLIPSAQVIPVDIAVSETPAIYSGIPMVNSAVNPLFTTYLAPEAQTLDKLLLIASAAWLGGVAALVIYSVVSSLQLRWQVRISMPVGENVYLCDQVQSPFVFGILRPKIYLPSDISEEQTQYVLAHEYAHIRRRDHWWKPLGFALLTVYWFNPLLWVAYVLLCRDIEQACDEKVVAPMTAADKKGYSQALLACSVHRRMIAACPIAFGEVSVKTRIKGVLRYKKPAFWIIVASVVVCVIVAGCFLTNPVGCRHTYTGRIDRAPTCTQRGTQTNTCELCQHSYTQFVPRLEHSYDEGTITVASTCMNTGRKEFSCTDCGATRKETIEKTDHVAGMPYGYTAPDCSHTGQRTATCIYCAGEIVTEVIPTNDVHDLHEHMLREPTCSLEGEGVYACSRCDYQQSITYAKTAHRYYETRRDEPDCTYTRYVYYACRDCDATTFSELQNTGHIWVSTGNGYKECKSCGWRQKEENIWPLAGTLADPNYPQMPSSPSVNVDDPFG